MSDPARFRSPATVVAGAGAQDAVADEVRRLRASRVLVVTDRFLVETGAATRCIEALRSADVAAAVFDDVQPDPTVVNVDAGARALRAFEADCVAPRGGGSVIDADKMIAVRQANPGPLDRYQGYHRIPEAGVPLVVLPTTAGTGSEATGVAVITDTARSTKMMILDPHLVPGVAIIDPLLRATMPPARTANVGVDTLPHGLEAYVSRLAPPLSDVHALRCIELVAASLAPAHANGADIAAREGMALAAYHGGIAFSNASVGLVHGMSRPVGALFHVPHGLSNAVLLAAVTHFSLASARARYGPRRRCSASRQATRRPRTRRTRSCRVSTPGSRSSASRACGTSSASTATRSSATCRRWPRMRSPRAAPPATRACPRPRRSSPCTRRRGDAPPTGGAPSWVTCTSASTSSSRAAST